ncbi:MAG: hypothetical protein AB7I98_20805 [Verrucomicrobiales bacterium]
MDSDGVAHVVIRQILHDQPPTGPPLLGAVYQDVEETRDNGVLVRRLSWTPNSGH